MEKKIESKITPKVVFRSLNKSSATLKGFLNSYGEYLMSSELSEITTPIIQEYENGVSYPTPTLNKLREAIGRHIVQSEINKVAEKLNKANSVDTIKVSNNFKVKIYNKEGVETWVSREFPLPQRASDWADRTLFSEEPCSYAVIYKGNKEYERVSRDVAIARILKSKRGTVCKKQGKAVPRLSWGAKAKQSSCKFSRG